MMTFRKRHGKASRRNHNLSTAWRPRLEHLEQRMLLAGDVALGELVEISVGIEPARVTVADLDGDGHQDLVTHGREQDTIAVLLNDGTGEFPDITRYAPDGIAPNFSAVGDMTNDDVPDLVVGLCNTNSVNVFVGNGDGTFADPINKKTIATDVMQRTGVFCPAGIVLGHFDDDGDLDVAVTHQNQGQRPNGDVRVLLGRGDGTLEDRVVYPVVGRMTTGVTAGDFNHDDNLDLAVANWGPNGDSVVDVLLGNGDGTFAEAQPLEVSVIRAIYEDAFVIETADINGDDNLDLMANTPRGPLFFFGNGDGTFAPGFLHSTYPELPLTSWGGGLDVGDLNGDGFPDVALSNYFRHDEKLGVITVMLGNEEGTFDNPIEFQAGKRPAHAIAMADLDGDGDLDLVAVDTRLGGGSSSRANSLSLLFNATPVQTPDVAGDANRDGVFDRFDILQVLQAGKYGTGEPADWLEGDWNGSGFFDQLDIVHALAAGEYVS